MIILSDFVYDQEGREGKPTFMFTLAEVNMHDSICFFVITQNVSFTCQTDANLQIFF